MEGRAMTEAAVADQQSASGTSDAVPGHGAGISLVGPSSPTAASIRSYA